MGLNAGVDQTKAGSQERFDSTILPAFFSQLGTYGSGSVALDKTALAFGAQAGFNHQVDRRVVGLEMDLQTFANNETTNSATVVGPHPVAGTISTTFTAVQRLRWLGTVRGRLGYTITPTLLLYGTAGLAFGETSMSGNLVQTLTAFPATSPGLASASSTSIRLGWTIGAGMEWLFAPRWSTKVEYLYYDLGTLEATSSFRFPAVNTTVGTTAMRADFQDHLFRVGLNYKLN